MKHPYRNLALTITEPCGSTEIHGRHAYGVRLLCDGTENRAFGPDGPVQ